MSGITNPAEAFFKDGTWGWDGSAWQKLPLVWGYSDRWAQIITGTAAGAGDATADSTPVDAGYVYVLQAASVIQLAGVAKRTYLALYDGTNLVLLRDDVNLAHDTWVFWSGEAMLKEGDVVRIVTDAPGAGKENVLRLWGYKMKIAE